MAVNQNSNKWINRFITSQVIQRGLDERTAKAYRLDLEHLYQWLELQYSFGKEELAKKIEAYLEYLSSDKKHRPSTICRKQRVFGYYLSYLASQGMIEGTDTIKHVNIRNEEHRRVLLNKTEIDRFFQAISQEYMDLESDFRKRVCLRDQVMMGLLFYHGIEVSELLRMKTRDYNQKTAVFTIEKKNGKNFSDYLFSRRLQRQMEEWIAKHTYFEHGEGYDDYMFLSKLGRPLSMKMVIIIFNKYRDMAGITKEATPKDLKYSMKTYARELMVEICSQEGRGR